MTVRTPRGYEVTRPAFLEISQGERPKIRNLHPAPFLPVQTLDRRFDEYTVINSGQILGIQAWQGTDYLVPANGGASNVSIVYTTADIGIVEDVANAGSAVAAAADSGVDYAANKPIGWAWFNMYNYYTAGTLWTNYQIMHDEVTTLNRYLVEFPLRYSAQDNFVAGDLIVPSTAGVPIPYDENVTTTTAATLAADIEQICGRVLEKFQILTGTNSRDRLDLVRTVKNSGVSGSDTLGVEGHLRKLRDGSSTVYCTYGVRANILLL